MARQVTAKSMRTIYGESLLKIGYCNLQHLLRYENPFAYSAGMYGLNCNYYLFDDVCISTGYRPIGECVPYDLTRKYDNAARTILENRELGYETKKEKVTNLLTEFLKEASEI